MTQHTTPTGGIEPVLAQIASHIRRLELRGEAAYLVRRINIAKVKMEHGLLTEEEQDALVLEGAELKADIQLWKAYR